MKPLWVFRRKAAFLLLFVLFGCSIRQEIRPVSNIKTEEICIIEAPAVRAGFIKIYKEILQKMGYSYKIVSSNSSFNVCKVTSTYYALWSWDLALYMSFAEIKVYNDGRLVGEAIYDSRGGGLNPNKFIKGENKIRELVMELFPN